MVKSAIGIEAVYMCFNGTGIWGGETTRTTLNIMWNSIALTFNVFTELANTTKYVGGDLYNIIITK